MYHSSLLVSNQSTINLISIHLSNSFALFFSPSRATFQCLRALPSVASKGSVSLSQHNTRDWHFTCTFPHSDPRFNALAQSAVAGCSGFRTDIWLHGNELQMGPSDAGPAAINDMQSRLDSLISKLGSRDLSTDIQIPLSAEGESSNDVPEENTSHSFWLLLDPKSSVNELFPYLVSHLDSLRQRDLLTHWDGDRVVQRPFTVLLTGKSSPQSNCADHSYTDVFWISTDDTIPWDDARKDQLAPICGV